MIKTIGELKEAINNIDDDFTIDVRIVRELSEEELKGSRYPYPYEYSKANIEIGDIGYSDKDVFINVYEGDVADSVCEYEYNVAQSRDIFFLTSCGHRHNGRLDNDLPYCGFCGKKIKVVE